MPLAPTLPVNVTPGSGGHIANTNTVHGIVNAVYLSPIGTTQTLAFTLTQANSGELVPVNSSSSVTVSVPVLAVGTSIEVVRMGTGAVPFSAVGVAFIYPAGAGLSCRVQGSTVSLLWMTANTVLVGGDLS